MTRPAARKVRVLDIQKISAAGSGEEAILELPVPARIRTVKCDVLITGAGLGGVAAALRAARAGHNVCLLEETDWPGGQMTAQGVSALDEHPFIETFGGAATYYRLRQEIRAAYRDKLRPGPRPLAPGPFNPGNCWVSTLAFEPAVAAEILRRWLEEQRGIRVFYRTKTAQVLRRGRRLAAVRAVDLDRRTWTDFRPRYAIDATEIGDLLPPAGEPYVAGAEPRRQTGEPHAIPGPVAQVSHTQSFTYTFALEFQPGTRHSTPTPPQYERFRATGKYSFRYRYPARPRTYKMFVKAPGSLGPFWTYRRLVDAAQFRRESYPRDISMINWQGNDFCGPELLSEDPRAQARALAQAKRFSLGFLHWLQEEAPRDEGGRGYPELALRADVMGTTDGLSKYPYIRESRRARTLETVVEQDISAEFQKGPLARLFPNSVAIGFYPIDIHYCAGPKIGAATRPFQLPLGALIPRRTENLILGNKNIGTTHITNGAYRLHPVEWAIGEAAGELAALALEKRRAPRAIYRSKKLTSELQRRLVAGGAPVEWPITESPA